jgi:hypothetical protein
VSAVLASPEHRAHAEWLTIPRVLAFALSAVLVRLARPPTVVRLPALEAVEQVRQCEGAVLTLPRIGAHAPRCDAETTATAAVRVDVALLPTARNVTLVECASCAIEHDVLSVVLERSRLCRAAHGERASDVAVVVDGGS